MSIPAILLTRLKSLGDVVLTLPAAALVRENFPNGRIVFLTARENAQLLQGFGMVDEVVVLDRQAFRQGRVWEGVKNVLEVGRRLRREKFSLAVDFQGYGETAILARITGAEGRWGVAGRTHRRWAFTHSVPRDPNGHPIDVNCGLLTGAGLRAVPVRNEFRLAPEHLTAAREFLGGQGFVEGRPLVYVQPFTSSPHKNWPLEHYLAVAQVWRGRGAQVIFGGGPGDRAGLERARAEGFPLATGIPRLTDAGLMKLSALVVGGDTGFLHLAVALGRRVLMLMTYAGPGMAIPYGHPEWALAPVGGARLADVSPEAVLGAVADVI